MISSERKFKVTNLKLTGELNNEDFKIIREMAGCYKADGSKYDEHLQYLDLEKVKLKDSGSNSFSAFCDLKDNHSFYGDYSAREHNRPSPFNVSVKSNEIDGAFIYLYDLKSLVLPEGVSHIGERTFLCCHSLSSLTLPSTLVSVDYDAFLNTGLDSLSLYVRAVTPPTLQNTRCRYSYDYNERKWTWSEEDPFAFCGGKTLYIPEGSSYLYQYGSWHGAFFLYFKNVVEFDPMPSDELITQQRIVNVERPGSLSSLINDYDKYRITNLKLKGELDISDVIFIREMAGCYAGVGVPKYNGHLLHLDMSEVKFKHFSDWDQSEKIYSKSGLKDQACIKSVKITDKLFAYLYNLQSVVLPDDFSDDYRGVLLDCSGLTSISIPSSMTSIGDEVFIYCN